MHPASGPTRDLPIIERAEHGQFGAGPASLLSFGAADVLGQVDAQSGPPMFDRRDTHIQLQREFAIGSRAKQGIFLVRPRMQLTIENRDLETFTVRANQLLRESKTRGELQVGQGSQEVFFLLRPSVALGIRSGNLEPTATQGDGAAGAVEELGEFGVRAFP